MKIIFNLVFIISAVASQVAQIYVQQSFDDFPIQGDGSELSPFSSLSLAFGAINSSADIILLGDFYMVDREESYENLKASTAVTISIRAQNAFFLIFGDGSISCQQDRFLNLIKFKLTGVVIVAIPNSNSKYLLKGNCNFVIQDIYMNGLDKVFLSPEKGTNMEFKNVEVKRITSNFIFTVREDWEPQFPVKGYSCEKDPNCKVTFDSVFLTAMYALSTVSASSKNFIFKNCTFYGLSVIIDDFKQNNYINMHVINSTIQNGYIRAISILVANIENSIFGSSYFKLDNSGNRTPIININNCTFENSTKGPLIWDGLFLSSSSLEGFITNSKFFSNNPEDDQESPIGFSEFTRMNIEIRNCYFKSNRAKLMGGVISIRKYDIDYSVVTLTLSDNVFESNSATYGGVICFNYNGEFEITSINNKFINNTAKYGAAIAFYESEATVKFYMISSDFISNTAIDGGVMYLEKGSLEVDLIFEDNMFASNTALYGGIFNIESLTRFMATLNNNFYANNKATYGGAVLKLQGDGTIQITGSVFSANIADNRGGVILIDSGKFETNLICEKNLFQSNAAFEGGVFYFSPFMKMQATLTNNTYIGNNAKYGGVLCTRNLDDKFFVFDLELLITTSKFSGNQASVVGGVLAFSGVDKVKVTVALSEFKSNSAPKGGGVINFETVESETTLTLEDSIFYSNFATNGGVINFESLNQIEIILRNNTYTSNTATIGAALAMQSLRRSKPYDNFTVSIIDSDFHNNTASSVGGALAFIGFEGGKISVITSQFKTNTAGVKGGVIYATQGESGVVINFQKSLFESNSAYIGGVIYFESMDETQIMLENNDYISNKATLDAGVGYITESSLIMKDFNSTARGYFYKLTSYLKSVLGNLAENEGGVWSINSLLSEASFENIVFEETSAKFRGELLLNTISEELGGCIYCSVSSLMLTNITFQNCITSEKASSGGALFITGTSRIHANDLNFVNNQAELGASIFLQSVAEEPDHTFDKIEFTSNLEKIDIKIQSQIQSNIGNLLLKNVTIHELNTPFLSHTSGSLRITDIYVYNVKCDAKDNLLTFCLLSLIQNSTFLALNGLIIQNVSSKVPLILSTGSYISLNSVRISNVTLALDASVALLQSCKISIDGIQLSNISSNFIQTANDSALNISNGIFNNQERTNNDSIPTQFIVLSDSSVKIESTSFAFNSPVLPQSGGAIRLTNPKRMELRNVSFTGNRAMNGGALFIEGSTTDAIISNCSFTNNIASKENFNGRGFGGAIFIQNLTTASHSRIIQQQYNKETFIIENSFFKNDSALVGGAIYSKEISLLLKNVTFDSNRAQSGGGLAIDNEDQNLVVEILQSRFDSNIANLYGGSILQLRQDVIRDQTGTTFTNGTQLFDRGVPAKLRIKTFSYNNSVQLLINSFTVSELENLGFLTLENDSFYDQNIKLDNVKSGNALNKLLEISVYDSKDNLLSELQSDQNQISLSVSNAFYPAKSNNNMSYIAGVARKSLVNGSVFFFEEINLFAFPGTLLDIEVSASIVHRDLGYLEYVLSTKFQAQLSNCEIGEIFQQTTLICNPCQANYFSLEDPFLANICHECDLAKADCPGGSLIYPKPGYWRLSAMSDNVVACPFPRACLGGKIKSSDQEFQNLTGFCNDIEGYEGNACFACKPGYAKFGSGKQCTNCKNDNIYYLKLVGLSVLQLGLIAFNIYSNLRPGATTEEDKAKETLTLVQGTVTKVLVDYMQIFAMIATIEIEWPVGLGGFGSVVSKGIPSGKDVFTVDCFFALANDTNEKIFFYKLLILNFQPFFLSICGGILGIILTKIRKQSLRDNPQFMNNLLVTNCLIGYILQPEIIKSTLQLFKCQNLGSLSNPQNFLEQDLEIKCGEPIHLAWALGLGIPSIIFWFVFPAILFIRVLLKRKEIIKSSGTLQRYHFVFQRYREERIYWDLVILSRKVALIFVLVFLNDLYYQFLLSLGFCLASLRLHYKMKPYIENLNLNNLTQPNFNLNQVETMSLISNCFLLLGGLFFIQNKQLGVVHVFLIVIILLCNLLLFLMIAKVFYWVILNKVKLLLKSKKKIQAQIVNENLMQNAGLKNVDEENKELISLKTLHGVKSLKE